MGLNKHPRTLHHCFILETLGSGCKVLLITCVIAREHWTRHLFTVLATQTCAMPPSKLATIIINEFRCSIELCFSVFFWGWVFTYKSSWVCRISLPRCLTCTCSTEWNHFCCSLLFIRSARSSITATRQSRRTQCSSTRRFILPADVETCRGVSSVEANEGPIATLSGPSTRNRIGRAENGWTILLKLLKYVHFFGAAFPLSLGMKRMNRSTPNKHQQNM